MSGGYFDYNQYRINDIADEISKLIATNNDATLDEWGDRIGEFYDDEVITMFRDGLEALERAAIYAQRIDWLVSGDDGPKTFMKRLEEDLDDAREGRPAHGRTPTVQIDGASLMANTPKGTTVPQTVENLQEIMSADAVLMLDKRIKERLANKSKNHVADNGAAQEAYKLGYIAGRIAGEQV